jgi:hypothetical protein
VVISASITGKFRCLLNLVQVRTGYGFTVAKYDLVHRQIGYVLLFGFQLDLVVCTSTLLPVPQDSTEPLRAGTKSTEFDENEGSGFRILTWTDSRAPINIVVEVCGKRLQGGADKPQEDANFSIEAGWDVVGIWYGYGKVIRIRDIKVEVVAGEEIGVYRAINT